MKFLHETDVNQIIYLCLWNFFLIPCDVIDSTLSPVVRNQNWTVRKLYFLYMVWYSHMGSHTKAGLFNFYSIISLCLLISLKSPSVLIYKEGRLVDIRIDRELMQIKQMYWSGWSGLCRFCNTHLYYLPSTNNQYAVDNSSLVNRHFGQSVYCLNFHECNFLLRL